MVSDGGELISALAGNQLARDGSPDAKVKAEAEWQAGHALQVMSAPQQRGDLILPSQEGHWETWTEEPSGRLRWPFSSGTSQEAHCALTDMPHWPQE